MGVQSLVRTLFFLTIVFIHIFPYINLSVWAQILTHVSLAFLCIWRVWHLCLLLSWCLFRVSWELVGIPPTLTDFPSWQPVITRVSLITTYVLFKGKKPFPIYCFGPVFLIVPSQCQVLTFYLPLHSFICSNMSHMWDFVAWYNTHALTINLMCHEKHLFILCLKCQWSFLLTGVAVTYAWRLR